MRIAWDLQAVTGPRPTGLGHSVRLLLDAFRQHLHEVDFDGLRPNAEDRPLIGVPDRVRWEQLRLPAELRRLQRLHGAKGQALIDLLYSPALGAPLRSPVPVVAHVHDLIPLHFPRQFSGWAGLYWKGLLPASWRRCRALTVSNSWLVREVSGRLSYPAERIHVVPYYADPGLGTMADRLEPQWRERAASGVRGIAGQSVTVAATSEPVFLCLGSHELRKNFALPIEALSILRQRGVNCRLRIIGGETPHSVELRNFARRAGVLAQVDFVGYAERERLVSEMLCATALLFLSRYEGYGMPPQEAQSLGLPVILSDIPCHRAVYDDPLRWAGVPAASATRVPFIEPGDSESLAGLMQLAIEDQAWRAGQAQAGLAYQHTFSSMHTATALKRAFESAIAGPAH